MYNIGRKVKLLIFTQKVDINDDVLGFFHGWIKEFARHCELVTVISLSVGEYDLPENVKVLSLGKEDVSQKSKVESRKLLDKLIYVIRFYKYIWQERKNYNTVFVHMNQVYAVLGGLLWKSGNKKIALWFTHKSVNLSLRIAEKFADYIFTASKESFRLPSKKVKIMGHGIPSQKFVKFIKSKVDGEFKIITIGRISPIKDYETLIKAVEILRRNEVLPRMRVDIIGGPAMAEDKKYLAELKKMVLKKKLEKIINFIGPVPNIKIIKYYNNADLFVHMSRTGSLDKAILEAMACGLPVISCNDASKSMLINYQDKLVYRLADANDLADKIKLIIKLPHSGRDKIGRGLRQIVVKDHSLDNLIERILKEINGKTDK